jgi:hypothetical protein
MLRTLMTSRRQTECRRAASPPSRSACPVTTPSQACGLRSERATGRSHIVLISLKMRCVVAVHSEFEIRVCGLCANPDINPSPTPWVKLTVKSVNRIRIRTKLREYYL